VTFEKINERCIALKCSAIVFNYFTRKLNMIVDPEYGYEDILKNQRFEFVFENCVFLCCSNASVLAQQGYTEFISWGKHDRSTCHKYSCDKLLNVFLEGKIGVEFATRDFAHTDSSRAGNNIFQHYFFQNAIGDALDIFCADVVVNKSSIDDRGEE